MIRWMRSAQVARGCQARAMQYAKEMAEFAQKYDGVGACTASVDAFGQSMTVRWMIDYEDLATLEKAMNQLFADQEYWASIEKNKELFLEGSVQDVVMRAI